ncbi:MAG: flagellar hook-basal body complex protein FliE [candidate division Zixibacteria bacterium]|nr:flagellar hook-basal body complex protein FliE [candidate division Zixibacteria bacterium]
MRTGQISPEQIGIQLPSTKINQTKNTEEIESFGNLLQSFIQDVNNLQGNADQMVQKFALGQVEDVHQVVVATEEANIAFQLLLEIRNKLIDAYHTLMQMGA